LSFLQYKKASFLKEAESTQAMITSTLVQTTQVPVDPQVIDLGVGQPHLSLLPLELIRQSAELRFSQNDPEFLQYGAEPGDGYLRIDLAKFLSQGYGFQVDPANLFITSGASMGLDLICTLFTRPGDVIFVEEPSYFLALRIFADHRLRPIPIPIDENGLVIAALEEALKTVHPAFLYTIPTYQNPSGYTLSQARRERLVALSQEHNFLGVADEVYHFLSYSTQPPTALAGASSQGNVISVGSFSKILAPGLRLGWIQTEADRVMKFASSGLLDSGGGLNPFTSAIVRGVLESHGLEANIAHLRSVYQDRLQALAGALQRYLPEASFSLPQGGYFFWVRLPDEMDAAKLLDCAAAHKVSFRPGVRFSSQSGLTNWMRLCFAFYEADQLEEGVRRLKACIDNI